MAGNRSLEESRRRNVHEFAGVWRRTHLRSFDKEEGAVFCDGREDRRGAMDTEGREGEHASLLLTLQYVLFLTNAADLIVAKRGTPAFTVERRYKVAEASTFATPVLLGSNILVRDATGLMLLSAGK